jgi:hypothetical protein
MGSWLRLLCVWLLAMALPLHGIAAATMPFHPSVLAGPAATAMDHSRHATAGHATAAAGDCAGNPASHDPAAHSKTKCSACTVCGTASALPPGTPTVPGVKPAIEPATVVAARYADPGVAGLERPPRACLA